MASSLYRLLAARIGNGYESAKSRHLFRDFIDASAGVTIMPFAAGASARELLWSDMRGLLA